MNAILEFIVPRLRERSTYVGLVGILTALGVAVDPQYLEIAIALGSGIAGLIGVLWKDKTAA
ncbi:hypothetical protein E4M02_04245 [Brevundimonas sp. S30B]|uniref:hypothetical protein n=1 Tax=unclassified Brevundimonas TaxID=2622653 RepID=UPI001071C872|nr:MULTISPECIES: hypothetical protein [unclassified Brevundimonas]QBX36917.1 hypothetical protein E4M01_03570 [Brevundimonas sp. MF30-B]TFW04288.1 hypothetical protein E4M02_04245 [Brevundimonas sp. S30B]